jgi:hypothetical protein
LPVFVDDFNKAIVFWVTLADRLFYALELAQDSNRNKSFDKANSGPFQAFLASFFNNLVA